ncbi:acyltransferase family protein [Anaerorhabdus furcosa]|uniref:Surface polysaccharide O-acyltransferase, integral membrane enzyme n=1 Tax=Anaerorhabdus furcosa TaxID=118967 RepID=A0A1T4LEX2_9FIRM|nr:acyltransferase [Anaerorhabdus furcosa]SJZ53223.1 Surface polysaccharide O-acyltransferase, integral membrane enzyme [Anaerorhabdus furcosa]
MMEEYKELQNYKIIDYVKYIAAIMIVCIHCTQLFPIDILDFFFRQIICRVAVPFFFISSAYFFRKGYNKDQKYLGKYLKKSIYSYLLWSIIFLPIGLNWIQQNLTISEELMPIAFLVGLFHTGTYYHLWYIPAMIFSLFAITKLLKYFGYKTIIIVCFGFFLFGSIETYYGFLQNGWFKDFFDLLISFMFTTRSGLFYGLIFVTLGFYIVDHQEDLRRNIKGMRIATIVCALLLIIEGFAIYNVPGLDMNFLIMLVPFSFVSFITLLSCPIAIKNDTRRVRELSKYIYFIHPVCIVIIEEIGKAFDLPILASGIVSLVFILILSHMLSSFIIVLHQVYLKRKTIFFSLIIGMLFTSITASYFYEQIPSSFVVKFEWTSCICFFLSFTSCYLLTLRKIRKQGRLNF